MQQRLLVATGTACALLLSACGMRVNDATRQELLTQSLHGGGSGTGGASTSGSDGAATSGGTGALTKGAATTGSGASGTTGAGSTGSGTTGTGSGTSGAGTSGATSAGTTGQAVGNGGATDVGVTATSITVGLVADQTGPAPGLFDGDVAGAQAYFAYINSKGGVNGRQLKIKVADSALDCNQTNNAYASLAPSIFAFVGNLSNFDNCGAPVLLANPKIPDVSFALTNEHQAVPSNYSILPTAPGARLGPPLAFKQAFPDVVPALGGLYADVASGKAQWEAYKQAVQSLGFKVVYEQAVPATEVDYTRYVIGMRQAGVRMAVLYNTAASNEKFVTAAQSQSFSPEVITAPGTMYDPTFSAAVGNGPTDIYDDLSTALFFNADEAKSIPGVQLFQTWMHKTAPEQSLDEFSVFGWGEAGLFVQALTAAGPKATRSSVLETLKQIHSYDAMGLIASGDPGRKKPGLCYALVHYDKGVWKRFRTPATGFRCDAGYFYAT